MVAAGLGFAFMPANSVKHPGVIGLPVVEPEFWRQVSLVSVRGRRYSPAVGSLVREAMRKTWFGRRPERVMDSASALAPAGAGEAAARRCEIAEAASSPRRRAGFIDGGYRIDCE